MMTGRRALILGAAAALAAMPTMAPAQALENNLIVNGDAESGPAGNGEPVASVPGFTTTGEFTAVSYSAGGGYPDSGTPGAGMGGTAFFAGGGVASSAGFQRISVAGLSPVIDLGTTSYTLSALLGGYSGQGDNATLGITFLGAGLNSIGGAVIGPVTSADRGDVTSFLARSTTGFVPVGTRSIDVLLSLARFNGAANDGYADNLSLVLDAPGQAGAVPEPSAWAMMILGFGISGAVVRRRGAKRVMRMA